MTTPNATPGSSPFNATAATPFRRAVRIAARSAFLQAVVDKHPRYHQSPDRQQADL